MFTLFPQETIVFPFKRAKHLKFSHKMKLHMHSEELIRYMYECTHQQPIKLKENIKFVRHIRGNITLDFHISRNFYVPS